MIFYPVLVLTGGDSETYRNVVLYGVVPSLVRYVVNFGRGP